MGAFERYIEQQREIIRNCYEQERAERERIESSLVLRIWDHIRSAMATL